MRGLHKHRTAGWWPARLTWKWVTAIAIVTLLLAFVTVAAITGWPRYGQVMRLKDQVLGRASHPSAAGASPARTAEAAVAADPTRSPASSPAPRASAVTFCKQPNGDGTTTYVAVGTGNTVFVDANGFVYWQLTSTANLERAHMAGSYVPYPGGAVYGPYAFWQIFVSGKDWVQPGDLPSANSRDTAKQAYDAFIKSWKSVLDGPVPGC